MWDGIGTLGIGILLGVIAIVLAIEMKGLLIGESATRDNVRLIEAPSPGYRRSAVDRPAHQHLGPEELLVGANFSSGTLST